MSRGDLNRGFFGPLFILGLLTMSFAVSSDPTGDCTSGTQYCEDNGLTTINTTVTTNTNTNNNTNNNTNTNTNTNSNTNNNTNVNTNTNTSTNNNNNVNTSTNTNNNVNTSTSTSNNTNTNNNVNTSTSTSNSTVNSTVNQNVNNNSNSTSNNTNTNTNNNNSNSTSNNTNTNNNNSKSESNVTTDNKNVNENTSQNTNKNYNKSESTQTINQNINQKAPPASAIAPSIMSYSQDLCTVGRSGAFQGQVFGISTGATVTDENCERLKLSKYVYDMGMKVAAVALLCQDTRVFQAMEMAGTPCPYEGEIGAKAQIKWDENAHQRPDAKDYKKKVKADKKAQAKKDKASAKAAAAIENDKYDLFMTGCRNTRNDEGLWKGRATCRAEWKVVNAETNISS